MLEWCRISYINRVRRDVNKKQNHILWHTSQQRVGWMRGVCNTTRSQQTANACAFNKHIKAEPSTLNQSHHQPNPKVLAQTIATHSAGSLGGQHRKKKHTRLARGCISNFGLDGHGDLHDTPCTQPCKYDSHPQGTRATGQHLPTCRRRLSMQRLVSKAFTTQL